METIARDTPALHGGLPIFPNRVPFIRPTLPPIERVFTEYEKAYANGLITDAHLVAQFEKEVAEYLDVRYCVAVSSCTSGLTLVMRALGLSGEIILPSFTFFATGHAACWNQLKPAFADCHPRTWNIDPLDAERRITPRTAAIVGVHLYGNPCDMEALAGLASRRHIPLVFDGAHAFGSRYRGRSIATFGDATVFSLSPTKLLVAGEGGLVATQSLRLAESVRSMRNYGHRGNYDPDWIGANARMPEFNAALGLAGLTMIDNKLRARASMARKYTELLQGVPGIAFQDVHSGDTHAYKDYCVHISSREFGVGRDELAAALLEENIETRKYFDPPLHKQKLYREFHRSNDTPLKNTEAIAGGILSLPIYESLPEESIEGIAAAIRRVHEFSRR